MNANWKNLDGSCFTFHRALVEHSTAISNCKKIGGKLFEPKNQEMNDLVAKTAQGKFDNELYWIGIEDKNKEVKKKLKFIDI